MKNKINKVFEKNIVGVRAICIKDGHVLNSTEWDSFFEYRVDDIQNYVEEVAGYLEWKEKILNDRCVGKFEIILLDVYLKLGV